jgi:hypothetical protein
MTDIRHRVGIAAPQTVVLFTPPAGREPVELMHHCRSPGSSRDHRPHIRGKIRESALAGSSSTGPRMPALSYFAAGDTDPSGGPWTTAPGSSPGSASCLVAPPTAWELSCRQRSRSQIRDAPTELLHPRAELGDRCPQAQMGRHIPRRSDSAI